MPSHSSGPLTWRSPHVPAHAELACEERVETGDAALHRVADIVDVKFVTVRPSVQVADSAAIIPQEGAL